MHLRAVGQDGVGPLRRSRAPPLRLVPVTRPRRCSIGRRSCPGPPGSAAFPSAAARRGHPSPCRQYGRSDMDPTGASPWTRVSRQCLARSVRWSTERAISPRHTSAPRTIRPPEVAWLTHPRSCHRALARLKESTHRLSMRPSGQKGRVSRRICTGPRDWARPTLTGPEDLVPGPSADDPLPNDRSTPH